MSFKKKSTYIKHECEYNSQDGEIYDISVIKHGERVYIQWCLKDEKSEDPYSAGSAEDKSKNSCSNNQIITIDGQMLEGLYSVFSSIINPNNSNKQETGLKRPHVIDHRFIQTSVDDSMNKYDPDINPIQSFNKFDPVGDTPEEWSMQNMDEDWKLDVSNRRVSKNQNYKTRGSEGYKFKRKVGASDII